MNSVTSTSSSYDFTTKINRKGQGSAKWNLMYTQAEGSSLDGIVPFSVADMELPHPPEIINAIHRLLDTTILGYTMPKDSYFEAVITWQAKRHGWTPQKEWIVTSPGVVPAFHAAIRALSNPGEGVIIQQPVYYPFMRAITINNRIIVNNALINNRDTCTYQIDFADLEQKAAAPQNKILLLCSPHNPVGRVWTQHELQRIIDICTRHDVFIISDEIHDDLIMPGHKHTTLLSLMDDTQQTCAMVCTAPSKTFNLAGFQTSNIFIPDKAIREKFQLEFTKLGLGMLNAFGYTACETAYTMCEPWLEEVLKLIWHNYQVLSKLFSEHLPEVKVYPLEGTYLMWLDFSAWPLSQEELEEFLHTKAQLFLDEGYIFGEEGSCYERVNLAAPTQTLVEAFMRLREAADTVGIRKHQQA